jgi:hypothetical protein
MTPFTEVSGTMQGPPTNPRGCSYARVAHASAKHHSRVSPWRATGLLHAQVVHRFCFSRTLPAVSTIELPDETSRASFPQVHIGDHDTNLVFTVSQDSCPTRYNFNDSRKSRGVVCFFKLTQLTRIHIEQAHKRSN